MEKIEKLLKIIGFEKNNDYIKDSTFFIDNNFIYNDYIFCLHKLKKSYYTYLLKNGNYIFTNKNQNSWKEETLNFLKSYFKSELRKYKIKNIIK